MRPSGEVTDGLYLVDPIGGSARLLADAANFDALCWSPSGRLLAFARDRSLFIARIPPN
jgi:sugar lactone lactonase YvrE